MGEAYIEDRRDQPLMLMDTGRRKSPVKPQDTDTLALGLFYFPRQWGKKRHLYHLSHSLLITEAQLYQDGEPVIIIVAEAGSHIPSLDTGHETWCLRP